MKLTKLVYYLIEVKKSILIPKIFLTSFPLWDRFGCEFIILKIVSISVPWAK